VLIRSFAGLNPGDNLMKKTIYVFNDGEFKRKDNTLFFETEDGKKYLPVEDVKEIIVFGEVTLNKRFLEFLTQKEIILHFLNNYGYYVGSYYPREHLNSGYMILKQAEYFLDETKTESLSPAFFLNDHPVKLTSKLLGLKSSINSNFELSWLSKST